MHRRTLSLLYFLAILFSFPAQSDPFKVEAVAEVSGVPWGMVFVSQSRMVVTLRSGKAVLVDLRKGNSIEIKGVPEVYARGQGGLLDVAIDPDFHVNGWLYFSYSKIANGQATTALARAKLDRDTSWLTGRSCL